MRFQVKALDQDRTICVASVDAADALDAERQFADRGMKVISIGRDRRLRMTRRLSFPIVIFSQELIALLEAGLSLVEAIDTLTEKETNTSIAQTLEQVRARLSEGRTLSSALEELPGSFPPLYVATIRASEKSGSIQEALVRYVAYQEQIDLLKKKVISASIYPVILCAAGLLVSLFLLVYVVPGFSGIYDDLGTSVPAASRVLMAWGDLISTYPTEAAVVAASLIALFGYALTMQSVRAALANAVVAIPAIGRQLHTYQLARLYRTVGMLLRGGMPAVTALKMSTGLLSEGYQPSLSQAIRQITEGRPLAESLDEMGLTTPVSTRMLQVGQRSGNIGEMMERIATFYDRELERSVDVLTRLIEPILMIVIGIIIGLIVVLMYFPVFELAGSLQ